MKFMIDWFVVDKWSDLLFFETRLHSCYEYCIETVFHIYDVWVDSSAISCD